MGKIYVGQENVEIKLDSKVTLGTPDVLKIAYRKPDNTSGEFATNVNVVETTKAQYFTQAGDLGTVGDGVSGGRWIFQIYTELPGGFKGYGEPLERRIYEPEVV